MRRTSWLAVGLALAACNCESSLQPARSTSPPNTGGSAPVKPELRAHARSHFDAAAKLQLAVAQGRLTEARDTAAWFATTDMAKPAGWKPYAEDMRNAARSIERAGDVASAGSQIGELGRACSSCHEAAGARVTFSYPPAPEDDSTLEAQMRRHQWAATRLWEGVIGPADDAWTEGARVLASARFDVAKTVHEKPNAEVFELAERMRDHANRAAALTDHDERAVAYGELMETCASCHSIVRAHPVVDPPRAPLISGR